MGNAGGNGGDLQCDASAAFFAQKCPWCRESRDPRSLSLYAHACLQLLGKLNMFRHPAALTALTAFVSPFGRHLHGTDLP